MRVITDTPIKIEIAQAILNHLIVVKDCKAGELRKVGLLDGRAKQSERDAVMESLRNLSMIEAFGGSGRGRSYRITHMGILLRSSYDDLLKKLTSN